MVIDPPFATSELRLNTPQADTTTIFLPTVANSEAGTLVRLLDFGLTNASSQRVACSSSADAASSSITITFDHFDTNLDYDPGTHSLPPKHSLRSLRSHSSPSSSSS